MAKPPPMPTLPGPERVLHRTPEGTWEWAVVLDTAEPLSPLVRQALYWEHHRSMRHVLETN